MVDRYSNQKQIDAIKAEVAKIWPEIRSYSIGMYSIEGKRADTISVCVPEKGNKQRIEALKNLGFRKVYRELKGPPGYDAYFYLSGERSYYVTLRKELQK